MNTAVMGDLEEELATQILHVRYAGRGWNWHGERTFGAELKWARKNTENMLLKFLNEVRDEARAALAFLRTRGVLVEWRPISEAPKDGTPILGFYKTQDLDENMNSVYGTMQYVMRWVDSEWQEAEGEQYESFDPTHFTPLPSPPARTP